MTKPVDDGGGDGKKKEDPECSYWNGERLVPPSDPEWKKEACDRIANDSKQLVADITFVVNSGVWTHPPVNLRFNVPADIRELVESPAGAPRAMGLYGEGKTIKEVLLEAFGVEVEGDELGWLETRADASDSAGVVAAPTPAAMNDERMFGKAMPAIVKLRGAVANGLTAEQCAEVIKNGLASFSIDPELSDVAFVRIWAGGERAMIVEWMIPEASRQMKQEVLNLLS